jgi:hypothetical protein
MAQESASGRLVAVAAEAALRAGEIQKERY